MRPRIAARSLESREPVVGKLLEVVVPATATLKAESAATPAVVSSISPR